MGQAAALAAAEVSAALDTERANAASGQRAEAAARNALGRGEANNQALFAEIHKNTQHLTEQTEDLNTATSGAAVRMRCRSVN